MILCSVSTCFCLFICLFVVGNENAVLLVCSKVVEEGDHVFDRVHDYNWASEASPTLGCSIEISRDMYML